MNQHKTDFEALVKNSGIPVSEDAIRIEWEKEAIDANIPINNNSDYSPFWRIVIQLITKATHWLVRSLITHVLPNVFIKTASATFLDILAWAVSIERKPATKAKGQLIFSRTNTATVLTIPSGTEVQSAVINGKIYSLFTQNTVNFDIGQAEITIAVEADEVGQSYNLSAGYYSILPVPIAGLDSVINQSDWLLSIGADEESDDDLRLRCRNQFSALNQYHTNAVYLSLMTEFSGVSIDNIFFELNAPRGAGTANAYIMFDIGSPDESFLTPIQNYIMDEGNHGHGDDIQIFPMPETFHEIECDIYVPKIFTDDEVDDLKDKVAQFIQAAFRANDDYSPTLAKPFSLFSFSRLSSELHIKFSDIQSVEFYDYDIISELDIPRASSVIVNAL